MTPKEKANDLVLRFRRIPPSSVYTGVGDGEAKQCAIIAVDEIIESSPEDGQGFDGIKDYWQEVKNEIEKL